jgi:8-oxo-dGTP diphosphatase
MINVCCAIIENDGKILATRRGENMHLKGYWEFPGGKLEAGECIEECIIREIKEELNIDIKITGKLSNVEYTYPEKSICLIPFICKLSTYAIKLKDHSEFKWVEAQSWKQLKWAPADIFVIKNYLKGINPKAIEPFNQNLNNP